jgi:hypothetical protein
LSNTSDFFNSTTSPDGLIVRAATSLMFVPLQ